MAESGTSLNDAKLEGARVTIEFDAHGILSHQKPGPSSRDRVSGSDKLHFLRVSIR